MNRKKLARLVLIAKEFENAPPLSVPIKFVVQMIGADRFVVVSQMYGADAGVPPLPVKIRLPPETIGRANVVGGVGGATTAGAFVSRTLSKSP